MATPDELRAELAAARAEFAAALKDATDGWERTPESGDGEAAWSARQAAEHTIGADVLYASAVCVACGYPGLDRIQPSYTTAAEAEAGLREASALADGRLKYVTAKDLEATNQRGNTVEDMIRANAAHFRDHATQIRRAAQNSPE